MKRGIVGALLLALVGAGCTGQGGAGVYRPVSHEELTLAENTYGLAPKKDSSITYQPDVVIVGGGASSVVSQSNSGVSVVLRSGAPGLSDVKPGKVVFVTGRIVGKVVGTKKTSAGVEVCMAPVQLTDVVVLSVGLNDLLPQWASSAVFGLVVVVLAVAAEVKRRRLRDKAAGDDSTAQLRTDLMKHTYLMAFLGVSIIAFAVFIEVPRLM